MSVLQLSVFLLLIVLGGCSAQLSRTFYASTCANVSSVVRGVVEQAQRGDVRAGVKLIRLHFHDCFVNGCDVSILLDNADGIDSEQDARPNRNVEGYDIVDDIKTALESVCPGVVSFADILALASQVSVNLAGGPPYEIPLGRRDSRTANRQGANTEIPGHSASPDAHSSNFSAKGLDSTDLVALSGAHTFGRARRNTFSSRLYDFSGSGEVDPSIDSAYLETLRQACPENGNGGTLVNLYRSTPDNFDNDYFENLQSVRGLLRTGQELFSTSGADTVDIVNRFANSQSEFFDALSGP